MCEITGRSNSDVKMIASNDEIYFYLPFTQSSHCNVNVCLFEVPQQFVITIEKKKGELALVFFAETKDN